MPADTTPPERQEWNHLPQTPIVVSPFWQWPPKPYAVFRWYFDSWFFITINLMIVALSFEAYFLAATSLETASNTGLWILEIWARNAIIVSIVAGSLHLWSHNKKRLKLGMFHHQIHHRYFECSYGNLNVPWDILFGNWHDGTPVGKAKLSARLSARRRA